MPQRSQLDPTAIPPNALSRVFLIDVLNGGETHRIRLQGTYLVDAYQHDFTGRRLVDEEIPGISKSVTVRLLEGLCDDPAPRHFYGKTEFRFTDFYTEHEQVLLPFAKQDGSVSLVMGAIDFPGLQTGQIFLRG